MTRPNKLAGIVLGMLVPALAFGSATVATSTDSPHLMMGNPTQASAKPKQKNNFLVAKPFYALSYNNVKGTPNWVSWRLTKADLGNARRFPFKPDTNLPAGF